MSPTLLVDHSNLAQRAFYGTYRGPGQPILSASNGFPTNCIATWANMVGSLVDLVKPSRTIFVLDDVPVRRQMLHGGYKGDRQAKPEPLVKQLPVLRDILCNIGLEYCHHANEEADDLIATLARRHAAEGPVIIASGDKDFCQCVTPRVSLLVPQAGGLWKPVGENDVKATHGVTPAQFPYFLAMVGDDADCIPGIEKIGPGTAAKLLADNPDLSSLVLRIAAKKKWTREQAESELVRNLALTKAFDVPQAKVQRGVNASVAFQKLDELECRRAQRTLRSVLERYPAPGLARTEEVQATFDM